MVSTDCSGWTTSRRSGLLKFIYLCTSCSSSCPRGCSYCKGYLAGKPGSIARVTKPPSFQVCLHSFTAHFYHNSTPFTSATLGSEEVVSKWPALDLPLWQDWFSNVPSKNIAPHFGHSKYIKVYIYFKTKMNVWLVPSTCIWSNFSAVSDIHSVGLEQTLRELQFLELTHQPGVPTWSYPVGFPLKCVSYPSGIKMFLRPKLYNSTYIAFFLHSFLIL